MVTKEKKTEAELKALIMDEVRKHAEWSNIRDVAITRPVQQAPHHPNWGGAFISSGRGFTPAEANVMLTQLQNQYHLA